MDEEELLKKEIGDKKQRIKDLEAEKQSAKYGQGVNSVEYHEANVDLLKLEWQLAGLKVEMATNELMRAEEGTRAEKILETKLNSCEDDKETAKNNLEKAQNALEAVLSKIAAQEATAGRDLAFNQRLLETIDSAVNHSLKRAKIADSVSNSESENADILGYAVSFDKEISRMVDVDPEWSSDNFLRALTSTAITKEEDLQSVVLDFLNEEGLHDYLVADTHNKADNSLGRYKPDATLYVKLSNGEMPPIFCGYIALLVELSMAFDKSHWMKCRKYLKAMFDSNPERGLGYVLWITPKSMCLVSARRTDNSVQFDYSACQDLLVRNIDSFACGPGVATLMSVLKSAPAQLGFQAPVRVEVLNWLREKMFRLQRFLGSGASSTVYEVSCGEKVCALKHYKGAWEQNAWTTEVAAMSELAEVEGVPTLHQLHSDQEENERMQKMGIILLNEVCDVADVGDAVVDVETYKKLTSQFEATLKSVAKKGWRWSDCRPSNIRCYRNGDILRLMALDWNCAVRIGTKVPPIHGTVNFAPVHLLQSSAHEVDALAYHDMESWRHTRMAWEHNNFTVRFQKVRISRLSALENEARSRALALIVKFWENESKFTGG